MCRTGHAMPWVIGPDRSALPELTETESAAIVEFLTDLAPEPPVGKHRKP